jgi:Domain of unknown function (DUF222)/HNH endonuclease
MAADPEGPANSVSAAISVLATDLDHLRKLLLDDALAPLEQTDRVGVLREFERFRNRLAAVDHLLVSAAERFDLAGHACQPSVAKALTATLRISEREAAARVRAAEGLSERMTMTGERLPPARPVLAAAQEAGEVSTEQADLILRGLASVDRLGFDPTQIALAEEQLAEQARVFSPRELRPLIRRAIDWIDPDGTVPNDRLDDDRRHLLLKRTATGAYVGEFRLTAVVGAKLTAVLGGLAKPQNTRVATDMGESVEVDERSYSQRLHDALGELCDRTLRAGSAPGVGGTPASVIVTVDHETLQRKTGWATTSDGTPLRAADLLKVAGEAEIIPAVLATSGSILTLGRSRRLASRSQVQALIARDAGCSFPSCDRPPEWCERHHIKEWIDGGHTDLDNLTLLCAYHHHNFEQRGWNCQINHDRLPEWRPPRWIDPDQRPVMNARVGQGRWTGGTPDSGARAARVDVGGRSALGALPPVDPVSTVAVPVGSDSRNLVPPERGRA